MKHQFILGLSFMMMFAWLFGQPVYAQLSGGIYKVGAGNDADYATLADAVNAASTGITGDVIIELEGEEIGGERIYSETDFVLSGVNSGSFDFIIRPAVGTSVVFNGSFDIIGGSHGITLDGRPGGTGTENKMTFKQDDATAKERDSSIDIYQTSGDVTIRYCNIEFDSRYGIWASGFQNNGDTLAVDNCVLKTISETGYQGDGSAEYIRTLFYGGDITITNNIMYGLKQPTGATEHVGIFIWHEGPRDVNVKHTIENNVVTIEKAASSGFTGGIRINARRGVSRGDVFQFRHNTVLLTGANGSGVSFALAKDGANTAVYDSSHFEAINNIFLNRITGGGINTVYWLTSSDGDSDPLAGNDETVYNVDYNNLFASEGSLAVWGLGNLDDAANQTFNTLAEWQTFINAAANTTNVDPTFVGPEQDPPNLELQVDPLVDEWYKGTNTNVNTDIEGTPRRGIPAKGAYEVPGVLSGIVTVAADPNDVAGADYETMTDVLDEIRAVGLADTLIIELQNLFQVTDLEITDETGDPVFPTIIRPEANAEGVIFNGTTFVQFGARNFIFDGRPGGVGEEGVMIFRQQDNTANDAIFFRGGAQNLTLKFIKIEADSRWGIRAQFAAGAVTLENSVVTISNTGYEGSGGGSEYFRTLFFNGDVTLMNNKFYGLEQAAGSSEAVGIFLATPAPWQGGKAWTRTLINNVVELNKPAGVPFSGGIRLNQRNGQYEGDVFRAYHNTVIVKGEENTYNSKNGISFVLANDTKNRDEMPSQVFDVQNNIFINRITDAEGLDSAQHVVYWLPVSDGNLDGSAGMDLTEYTFDNNNIVPSELVAQIGVDDVTDVNNVAIATFADWQALGVAANTTTEVPVFEDESASPPLYALLIDDPDAATWYEGIDLGVEVDVQGDPRNETPTKGAYQFSFQDFLTSLDDINVDNIFVYPNPSPGNFMVKLKEGVYEQESFNLFTIDGRKVDNAQITLLGSDRLEVRLNHQLSGIYILRIKNNTGWEVHKLVKN